MLLHVQGAIVPSAIEPECQVRLPCKTRDKLLTGNDGSFKQQLNTSNLDS